MEKIKIRKAVQQRNSAEIVASVDDVLIEILLRLPIISLVRFETVSKHWQSLITSPRFCHLRNRTIGLMLPNDDFPEDGPFYEYVPFLDTAVNRKLEYFKDADLTEVLQSCNGILLCVSYFDKELRYYVCNPTTNQLSLVPQPEDDNCFTHHFSLAFDPARSPHYKVVCVMRLRNNLTQILIYSSETGAWGVCGDPFASSFNKFSKGVYWNGAVHWINRKRALYFKIEDQVLDEMPKVPFSNNRICGDKYYFGESCDHLHFLETRETQIQLKVYEMKRDHSEWFVKYKIDLSPVVAAYPEMIQDFNNPITGLGCYVFSVFCIVYGWKEEESFLVLQIPGKVIRVNLNHKTFITLLELERSDVYSESDLDECQECRAELRYQNTNGFQYIESLCNV